MNNKIETLLKQHIKRLEKDVAEVEAMSQQLFFHRGMETIKTKDDLKKIALLREGVVPKYSDLPASDGFENNLPEIEMFEFADLMDES
jgi:hypothetical protein